MQRSNTLTILILVAIVIGLSPVAARGGWLDTVKEVAPVIIDDGGSKTGTSATSALSSDEVISGLKQALNVAVDKATSSLGSPGGYLDNLDVRIPMPSSLTRAEQMARGLGQDKLADEFITSMNRAAEQAAPETVSIFSNAIRKMSFADARAILNGPDDAATKYFERTSSAALIKRIRPIVEKATDSVGVTSKYKSFMGGVSTLGAVTGMQVDDLDGYVTDKATEGLFLMMAREEKMIRDNPVARTTDLLRKVFGSVGK
ncbi:DUF4197 domain-containing protein [Desulfovibrio ferrophilus]|uniref:DUF4197 domain-containing protein n=1 Tax=Desulfovibrio ferrophilus TaxID=241368 RepID=A0A2Z6AW87_9BACT|nr:DUF4197 domain-containing protein [Desulfovibrio ferrophilus]BBD07453.1 uncharacterized protein DFE_0727 [Desulfovibrio ferrophilus]